MATITSAASLTLGGRVFVGSDITNMIYLRASVVTTGRYSSLVLVSSTGSTGYQVTAGKTLTLVAARIFHANSYASNPQMSLGYGDTSIGLKAGAAPTTPVYFHGANSEAMVSITQSSTYNEVDPVILIKIPMPAAKYPFIYNVSNNNFDVHFWGLEA